MPERPKFASHDEYFATMPEEVRAILRKVQSTVEAALLLLALPAVAADPDFGPLPAGAASTNVVKDVHAEICRDHLFDPSAVANLLPPEYRLVTASEAATKDPALAKLLAADAKLATHALGSLCFMSVGSFVVDGLRVPSRESTAMAFWWARATGPRDPRMQGKAEWLQLASWYPKDIADRRPVLATDPMAQFVDLTVRQDEPGLWRLRLALPGETVEAETRVTGPRTKRRAPEPGFMTVPFAGASAGSFWVITYFGHYHRSAEGKWRAEGRGTFANAFRIPGEASAFGTVFQEGWSALSGLYARSALTPGPASRPTCRAESPPGC